MFAHFHFDKPFHNWHGLSRHWQSHGLFYEHIGCCKTKLYKKDQGTWLCRTQITIPLLPYQFPLISIRFNEFQYSSRKFPGISIINEGCQRSPKIIDDCQRLPKIAKDCQRSPKIADDIPRMSKTAEDWRRLP